MRRLLLPATLWLLLSACATAQHTFSIVAVDSVTREVGSAGASCIAIDVSLIGALHPGIGAINTQAFYHPINQASASELMGQGKTPSEIIDFVRTNDAQNDPSIRQYGVVTLEGGGASAGFTGENCMNWAGHITGPGYSIQGNILLGPQILDSMEARFLRTPGPLADRLMAALQGANVPGADTRCSETSSLGAFIMVARPDDNDPYLALSVTIPGEAAEPIDSLQKMYDALIAISRTSTEKLHVANPLTIVPNPANAGARLHFSVLNSAEARVQVVDALGRSVAMRSLGHLQAGEQWISLDELALPTGMYTVMVRIGSHVMSTTAFIQRRD